MAVRTPRITFELQSQLFVSDAIPGTISFPFEIARTPESQKAFGYFDLISVSNSGTKRIDNCILYHRDTRLYNGTVYFLSSFDSYRISFNTGMSNLKTLSEQSLRSLTLGGVRTLPLLVGSQANFNLYANDVAAGTIEDFDYQFPTCRNPDIYQDVSFIQSGGSINHEYINHYDGGTYSQVIQSTSGAAPEVYYANTFVPYPYLAYVLKEIFKSASVRAVGSWLEDPEIRTLLMYNTYCADGPGVVSLPSTLNKTNALTLNLQNHVPDIPISQFLNSLRNQFNLIYYWNTFSNEVSIDSFKDIHASTKYVDWTSKLIGRPGIEITERSGYTFSYEQDSNDAVQIADNLLRHVINGGENAYETRSSLIELLSETDYVAGGKDWLIHQANQPGNSANFPVPPSAPNSAPFNLRLLFWRGMQPDSNSNDYPMGTPDLKRFNGTDIPGANYQLYWDGSKGLYNTWWKTYVDLFQKSKLVTVRVQLSLLEVLSIDIRQKVRLYDNLFYINKVKFDIGDVIKPVEVELYRI